MGDAVRSEVPGHPQRQRKAARLSGGGADKKRARGLRPEHLQGYLQCSKNKFQTTKEFITSESGDAVTLQ